MKPIWSAGATTAVKRTSPATVSRASDGTQPEHGHEVRDHAEHRRGERQRERPLERVLAAAPQLLVAARTARRCARDELREALQQVAVRAGDERGVGERLVVHGEVTVRDGTSYLTLRGTVLPFRANRSGCSVFRALRRAERQAADTAYHRPQRGD